MAGIGGSGGSGGSGGNGGTGVNGAPNNLATPGDPGPHGANAPAGKGIVNDGLIDMGNGHDTLDASIGGFGGTGTARMGKGSDTVKGFGTGKFEGGQSTLDRLVFGAGNYTVATGPGGLFDINNGTETMKLKEFEFINSLTATPFNLSFAAAVVAGGFSIS